MTALLALGSRISDVNVFAYLAAFGGGVVSFLSPCVLPLVPGYLSMVTGLDLATLEERRDGAHAAHRRHDRVVHRRLRHGVRAARADRGVRSASRSATTRQRSRALSGAVMLAMALFLLGSMFLRAPWLYQEKRFHPQLGRFGVAAPLVAGVAFGFGWSPCFGPILGSILGIAATQQRVWAGGTLLAVYSIGLGLPFLVTRPRARTASAARSAG